MTKFKITSLALLMLSFFSCSQNSDINDLQEAQLCLNSASNAEAMNCVSKISSNTSENAYKLRCAAIFISEGFGTAASFAPAIDALKNGQNNGSCSGAQCSGAVVAMSTFNFGTNTTKAAELFNQCSLSGVSSYSQISSIFKVGTDLVTLAGGATSVAAIEAQINNLPAESLGSLVQTVYSSGCSDPTQENQSYCTEIQSAIGSGLSNEQIGNCMKAKFDNPAYVGPLCPTP